MENAEAFLKTIGPMHLEDAPGGAAYLTASADTLRRGKIAFADKCARCHSSKQPPAEIATDRVKVDAWYRESVLSRRLPRQELPVRRSPVSGVPARHQHRARRRHQRDGRAGLGRVLVRDLQAAARRSARSAGLYNPRDPDEPLEFGISRAADAATTGRRRSSRCGRRRPICTTTRSGCSSRTRRSAAGCSSFYDATEKLLWPERRLGVQSIIVTSIDTELRIPGPRSARADPGGHAGRPDRARRSARGAARSPRTASC